MRSIQLDCAAILCSLGFLVSCSGSDGTPIETGAGGATVQGGSTGQGGLVGNGGSSSPGTGGSQSGGVNTGGSTSNGNGGASTAGSATGGGANTGGKSVGGANTGGATSNGAGGTNTGGKSAGGAAIGGSAVGGGAVGGSVTGGKATGGNATGGVSVGGGSTGGKAIGGDAAGGVTTGGAPAATGGAGTCTTTWSPPASANGNTNLAAGLDQVWAHSGSTIVAANNIKIHQVMANKGIMRYCVRWDSTTTINATERDQIEALIQKNEKQWWDQLKGWGCWPYTDITTSVTLWAARDRAYLNWDDSTTSGKVVVNSTADCPATCGPWAPNKAFASCTSAVYDEFFWLDGTVTTFTGWGSATGFMMGPTSFLSAAKSNANTYVILAHEMGHAHGLDDFYDWQPTGWTSWIMNAGSAASVTETDGWMLRDVWRHVRSKYGYPGP